MTSFDLSHSTGTCSELESGPTQFFLVMGQRAREFLCDFPKPTHFLKIAAQFVSLARGALHYNGIVGKVHLYAATS